MKMKPVLAICILAVFILLSACEPIPGTGTLQVQLYCQYYEDNPADLELEVALYSLIQIEGLTPEYYIGNDKGVITVNGVPESTYTVHPLFADTEYDKEMTVIADLTVSDVIVIPDMALEYYMVNPANITDVDFRTELAQGIDREDFLANTGTTGTPLYSMLPSGLRHDGLETSAAVVESAAVLSGTPSVDFTLRYNTSTLRQTLAEEAESQWEAYGGVGNINLESLEWSAFTTAAEEQDFDVIRFGWSLDSNNPIAFLKHIFDSTGYTSTDYETIIAALEEAQENALAGTDYLSLEDFHDYTDQLHSIIIDQGLAIPLYEN